MAAAPPTPVYELLPGERGANQRGEVRTVHIKIEKARKREGREARISVREREVETVRARERGEEVSGTSRSRLHPVAWQWMRRSMLAPQSLSCRRDYRTHNAAGHPPACRSPTWELQVWREEGAGKCRSEGKRAGFRERRAERMMGKQGGDGDGRKCSLYVFTCLLDQHPEYTKQERLQKEFEGGMVSLSAHTHTAWCH